MVDINNFIISLKYSWIKRLTNHINHGWIFYLPSMDMIFYRNYMILEILLYWNVYKKKTMPFGKMFFNSWLKYIKTIKRHPNIKDNFLNISVWNNSNIRVANKTVFIKCWYEKGIRVLQDFFYEDCNFLVFEAFK